MVYDPNKAKAHLQPPQPNPHLKNLDRLGGTWERQGAVFTSRSTRRLSQHLVAVHLYSRALGLPVFSASKVGGIRGSRTLLSGWHPPPTHIIRRPSPALLLLIISA
jgi:hypothetical protein